MEHLRLKLLGYQATFLHWRNAPHKEVGAVVQRIFGPAIEAAMRRAARAGKQEYKSWGSADLQMIVRSDCDHACRLLHKSGGDGGSTSRIGGSRGGGGGSGSKSSSSSSGPLSGRRFVMRVHRGLLRVEEEADTLVLSADGTDAFWERDPAPSPAGRAIGGRAGAVQEHSDVVFARHRRTVERGRRRTGATLPPLPSRPAQLCAACGAKDAASGEAGPLKQCGACKLVRYCSKARSPFAPWSPRRRKSSG